MIGVILILSVIGLLLVIIKPTPDNELYKDHFLDQDDFEEFERADNDARK